MYGVGGCLSLHATDFWLAKSKHAIPPASFVDMRPRKSAAAVK